MKNSGTILGYPQGYVLGVGVMIVMIVMFVQIEGKKGGYIVKIIFN